jgi:hypothetical protein
MVSTTGEGAALSSVRSVGLGSASIVVAGTQCQGAALASIRSFGVCLESHCGSEHDR